MTGLDLAKSAELQVIETVTTRRTVFLRSSKKVLDRWTSNQEIDSDL